jgi:hypothetical protein
MFLLALDLSKASHFDCSHFSIGILDHLKASHVLTVHTFSWADVSKASRLDGSYFSVGVYNLLKALRLDGSHFSVGILDLSKASCLNCSHFSVAHLSIGVLDQGLASLQFTPSPW